MQFMYVDLMGLISYYLQTGLLTQCIQSDNLVKLKKPVVENLMKKLNVKLGGINHLVSFPDSFKKVDILSCPTMIFGADVTHPQQGSRVSATLILMEKPTC